MCRSREEIISHDITCQELIDFIEQQKELIKQGKNGKIHFELLQARASLEERVARIQLREDMMMQFEKADTKRNGLDKKINGALTNIEACQKGLDKHLIDCDANPTLKRIFIEKPFKTIGIVLGLTTTFAIGFFFTAHALMFGTGFDIIFQKFLENIMGQ